jgi:tetratricopeptide (TPR) repeat protein
MRISVLMVEVAALFAFAGPIFVSRAVADDLEICDKASGDEAIAACTRAINSGSLQGKALAGAYNNRGVEYNGKDQHDRAIQDYDQAIRLNPNFAQTFNNRGRAYNDKGQIDRAIQDYDQAIRLYPNFAYAYCARGLAKRNQGDATGGTTDIAKGKELNPNVGDWCR